MTTSEFNKKVHDVVLHALKRANRIPYLFVGSGISRRYMGTENWNDLLEWVCNTVGAPMRKYAIYKQKIQAKGYDSELGPNPAIASSMETDFLDALENESLAEWTKKRNSDICNVPAMKMFIADHLHDDFRTRLMTDELNLLKKATRSIAGIITTNYDTLMEELFNGYKVYEEQDDLLFTQFTGIGEIYKIHGSINHPESMILDANDYKQFNEKAKYLIAKILTIFGEYPVIFLGYSISDPDVRKIIRAIADCAGQKRINEMEDRFIFVDYSQDKFTITPSSIDVGKKTAFKHLTCLYENEIDPDCLYNYLQEVASFEVPDDRRSKLKSMLEDSDMRRCIRIYDYLTYGKEYLNKKSASTVTINSVSPSNQEKHLTAQ